MFKDNELSRRAYITYLWFVGSCNVDENTPTFFNRQLFKEQSEFKSDTTIYKAIAELVRVGLFRITSKPSHYTVVSFDKATPYIEKGSDMTDWFTDNYHEYRATLDPNKDNEERLQGFLEGLAWSLR